MSANSVGRLTVTGDCLRCWLKREFSCNLCLFAVVWIVYEKYNIDLLIVDGHQSLIITRPLEPS